MWGLENDQTIPKRGDATHDKPSLQYCRHQRQVSNIDSPLNPAITVALYHLVVTTSWCTPCDKTPTGQANIWRRNRKPRARLSKSLRYITLYNETNWIVQSTRVKYVMGRKLQPVVEGTAAWFAILHMTEARLAAYRRKTRTFESTKVVTNEIERTIERQSYVR